MKKPNQTVKHLSQTKPKMGNLNRGKGRYLVLLEREIHANRKPNRNGKKTMHSEKRRKKKKKKRKERTRTDTQVEAICIPYVPKSDCNNITREIQ